MKLLHQIEEGATFQQDVALINYRFWHHSGMFALTLTFWRAPMYVLKFGKTWHWFFETLTIT